MNKWLKSGFCGDNKSVNLSSITFFVRCKNHAMDDNDPEEFPLHVCLGTCSGAKLWAFYPQT